VSARLASILVIGLCASLAAPPGRAQPSDPRTGASPPPAATGELGASQLSKLPKQTKFAEAAYPEQAIAQGLEADVILLLEIGADGKVGSVGIAEPSAWPGIGFEEAALAVAPQFEFEPAEQDGRAIAVQISYRYKFRLTPKQPPAAATASEPVAAGPVGNFSGALVERGTRAALPGLLVTVFRDDASGAPVGFEATTDAQGRFAFRDLAAGPWKVSIEAPGYYPFKTGETIGARESVDVTYHLERGSYNPFDVRVSAPRPRKEVSRTVLSAAEIDKVPGTAGDPLAVIQNFAGVARSGVGGQLIVRGSAPEDSRIFVDGGEVPLIYHFGAVRTVLPIGVLEGLEFYPGNFSPEYGRATGGVVDVRIKKLQPKKVGGYADVSLLDTGLFLEVPLGDKGGIAIAGRRSYVDAVIAAAVPDDGDFDIVTAPVYYDYQLLANYRPTPEHDLRAFLFGSDDRLKLLFQNPADLDPQLEQNSASAAFTFYRSQFGWRYTPGPHFENSLQISQGRNWIDLQFGQLTFDFNVYSTQLRDTVHHTFGEHWGLSYGVDVLFARGKVSARLPPMPQEGEPPDTMSDVDDAITGSSRATLVSPAAFVELELKPIAGLLLLPGVRVDRFGQVDEWVVQPRVTARWQFAQALTAKVGVGSFAQAPQFDQTDEAFGNPDLGVERALHYSVGLEYKPLPFLTFDVTAFYKDLSDLVSPTDRLTTRDGVMRPLRFDNGGEGRVYGAEVTLRHDFANRFTGWLVYTLSRAERLDTDATEERLFDFDQTHILTALGTYELPRNWQIGFRFRVVSGNPRTAVIGSLFDATEDRYEPIYGGVNRARGALFHQLDLRVDKRWVYQGFMLTAYLDIQNVYSHENEEGRSYNFDYSRSEAATGLPILPILGVRAEF
jgi:TonB family protein